MGATVSHCTCCISLCVLPPPPASQFDVDYLERLESSAPSEGGSSSSLARESLYVKFDPLVGRPSPDSVHKQRTPPTLTTTAAMGR